MTAAKVVVATTHFACTVGDKEVLVHTGERFASNHPIVKAHGQWFEAEHTDVKRPQQTRRSKP
jgi:hypothetical protein